MNQKSKAFVIVEVTKKDIMNMDIAVVTNLLSNFSDEPLYYHDTVHFLFQGFDHIDQEIFEIREIRNWVEKAILTHPEILFFLEDELNGLQNIFLCIAEYTMLTDIQGDNGNVLLSAFLPKQLIESILVRVSTNSALTRQPYIMERVTDRVLSFANV